MDAHQEAGNPAITKALEAIGEIVPLAEADPNRPVYHFRPPAGYHNDPNGPIWHNGYYHLFYQLHPFTRGKGTGDRIYWGHARSSDLVHWEHLPPALWPSEELGETICASGSTVIRPDGRPMIIYTSIEPVNLFAGAPEQWAALGDDDLVTWQKHPANPVLAKEVHCGLPIAHWRDPFMFEDEGSYYMVTGGRVNKADGSGRGCITIYRANDDSLTKWEFLSVLYEFPDDSAESLECPGMFQTGDKWVLFFSYYPPATRVAYMIGNLDKTSFKFTPELQDMMEYSPMGMYAPTAMRAPDGRIICWGWIRFAGWYPGGGRGWSGCMTLPYVLSARPDGWLAQEPAVELQTLRDKHYTTANLSLGSDTMALPIVGDALEIEAEFEVGEGSCGLVVRRSDDGERGVVIGYDGSQIHVTGADPTAVFDGTDELAGADYHAPLQLLRSEDTLRLHLFIDKCALELFVNGRACFRRAIYSPFEDLGVAVFGAGVSKLDVWTLKAAWDR